MQKQQAQHIGKLIREELNDTELNADEWLEALTRQLYDDLEQEQKLRRRIKPKTRRRRQT